MKRVIIVLAALLTACGAPSAGIGAAKKSDDAHLSEAERAIDRLKAADAGLQAAKAEAAAEAAETVAKAATSKLANAEPSRGSEGVTAPARLPGDPDPELCWADYCPCDTSDPDYGYADIPICRNLKMGINVEDKMFSLGAMGRDARRSIREHKEQYGGDF